GLGGWWRGRTCPCCATTGSGGGRPRCCRSPRRCTSSGRSTRPCSTAGDGAPRGRAAPMPVRTPSPRRAESGRARGSLPAGGPVHAPPVGVVDGALGAHPAFRDQVAGLALDDEVAVAGAGDQGEGAHRGGDGALVEREVDRGAVL